LYFLSSYSLSSSRVWSKTSNISESNLKSPRREFADLRISINPWVNTMPGFQIDIWITLQCRSTRILMIPIKSTTLGCWRHSRYLSLLFSSNKINSQKKDIKWKKIIRKRLNIKIFITMIITPLKVTNNCISKNTRRFITPSKWTVYN